MIDPVTFPSLNMPSTENKPEEKKQQHETTKYPLIYNVLQNAVVWSYRPMWFALLTLQINVFIKEIERRKIIKKYVLLTCRWAAIRFMSVADGHTKYTGKTDCRFLHKGVKDRPIFRHIRAFSHFCLFWHLPNMALKAKKKWGKRSAAECCGYRYLTFFPLRTMQFQLVQRYLLGYHSQ